jgi:hypothetical protein
MARSDLEGSGGGSSRSAGRGKSMIFAVDVQAVGHLLREGWLSCPGCGERLRVWTAARPRTVAMADGSVAELVPDRGRCRGCGATHVVLPAWYVPRRAYAVEVMGSVLLAGARTETRRRIADRLGLPVGTVSSWLTAARKAATSLVRQAYAVAGPAVRAHRSAAQWLGSKLAEALDALGDAAREFARGPSFPPARPPRPGETGIDYLRLLHAQHHRDLRRRLHVAPDSAMPSLEPWHVVNLITARRGLFRAVAA